jgi:putative ABC transport system permease protein
MFDVIRDTVRSLRGHAMRFFLTSLGILWGAFMLTYLSASMTGVEDHFTSTLENTGPKVVVLYPGFIIKNRVGERGARAIELEEEDVDSLRGLASIETISPNLRMYNKILRAGRRTKLLNVQGVDHESGEIRNFEVVEGRYITPTDVERAARVVFLGDESARRLFGNAPALGRTLQIESYRFRVIGIAEAKGDQLIGMMGRDDKAVIIPYTTAQRLFTQSDIIDEVMFAPLTRETSSDAIRHTRQLLGLRHRFDPELDTAASFFNVQDVMQILHTIFFGLRIFNTTAGIVTLIVGAIGVMNIMLVVVGERRNEIGLRKAVGATRRAIFLQFLVEATAVCSIAGLVGATLGVGFTRVVAASLPEDSPMQAVPVLDPATVATISLSLVLVGIVAGIVPAVRASQVDPSDALRAT